MAGGQAVPVTAEPSVANEFGFELEPERGGEGDAGQ
jgi:hypothetical protein